MSDVDVDHDDEGQREDEPNPTQGAMGEGEERPADVSWTDEEWGETPEESPLA